MQSSMMSGAFAGALRNPTIVAMFGSTVIHGLMVVTSTLKPAESQASNQLRIVNLAPNPGSTRGSGLASTLAVPNGLPPINLGDVPQLAPLPDISQLGIPNALSSQSFYVGNPSSLSVGQLPITNPPRPSMSVSQLPIYGIPNSSNASLPNGSGMFPLQPPIGTPFSNGAETGTVQVPSAQSSYPEYATSGNPSLPQLSSEPLRNSDLVNLYAKPAPVATAPSGASETAIESSASNNNSLSQTRDDFKSWIQAKSAAIGQPLSAQSGPRLTAAYPPSACKSQQQGSAVISAVYGPDGAVATGSGSVQVLESAATMELNRAAIAAVEAYRPPAAGVYQAFNFTVDIPYSTAVCGSTKLTAPAQTPQPSPSDAPQSSKTPAKTVPPQPSPSATTVPQGDLPTSKVLPSPAPTPIAEPSPSAPTEPRSEVPRKAPINPSPSASAAEVAPPSPSPAVPDVDNGNPPSLGPLPAPSIAVPEPSPKL